MSRIGWPSRGPKDHKGKDRKPGELMKSKARIKFEERKLGKLGPASEVRKIDPSEYSGPIPSGSK